MIGAPRCHRRFIQEFVKPRDKDRILDMGCGFGASARYLPDTVEYVGIDISEEYIASAQRSFGSRRRFICSAIEAVDPNPLGGFDLAISFGLLHHLNDQGVHAALSLASKAVRPGGRVVTIDPCYETKQPMLARFLINNDRGRFIRDSEGYRRLCLEYGKPVVHVVSDMLRIPYTQAIIDMQL
jgi:SAM-dependent methyltransferase